MSIPIISESATITAGSMGMFVCVAHGYPVPSLAWNKGETLLSNNSQSTIYEKQVETQSGVTFVQSILVICRLTEDDAAQYNCSASNNISSTSASLNLTVNRTYMHEMMSYVTRPFLVYLHIPFFNQYWSKWSTFDAKSG